ncbi:MAG TPA: efflux RND transporter periplasmic adaptor subunit [Parvibaculum sp.]
MPAILKNRWVQIAACVGILAIASAAFLLRAPAIETVKPVRGPAVEAVYATGTVEPVHYAQTGSKLAGRVTEVRVKEGDQVAKGDVLAVTDETEDASNVSQLAAKLALAQSDAARARKLRRTRDISVAALDQAESDLNAAQSALDAAKARLDDHFVRAPLSGVILRSEQQIKVGDMVQPQQTLFIVGDPSALQIDAAVDEEDIPKVKVGQDTLIRADAFPGQALSGAVSEITPYGDSVARTYRVHIALPADTPLRSGMTTEINIVVRRDDKALLVPVSALSGGTVWTVVEGRARRQKIDIGTVGQDKAEVRSGLSDDAVVIVDPPASLTEGARVRAASGS